MADTVKVEVDLVSGKLTLECSEASVESILSRLADFLPKFGEHASGLPRHSAHHTNSGNEQHKPERAIKPEDGSSESNSKKRASVARSNSTLDTRGAIQTLQLSVDEPALLVWGSLDKDWKKYLWILEAARIKGVDGLTNGEISYLMDKFFREARSPKVVNNIKQKIKERFVQPSTAVVDGKSYATWRILADGSKQVQPAKVSEA